ncbi:kinase [Flavobacterium sp. LS1P28]|uniref:kinase n=1 Tax=Flavobacterium sp. LS1P28 TaxID=2497752 RepID=UPI000F8174E9|nr:kinase [Flavobacterium sp. LS1P28]RTY80714.1 kinase [Flavobacterium sp. LS1P28]
MFEYYQNNILCVQASWIVESGIISEPNYKQLCSRGHLKKMTTGGNGRKALIQFDTMRSDIKNKVIELAGDPYAKVTTITFTDYILDDQKAYEFFRNYTLDSGEALPEKNIKEYCCNASIANAINTIVNSKLAQRKALAGSKVNVWERIAEVVSELPKHTYPHSLPRNQRILRDKVKQYLNDGYGVFIHKAFGSKNAEKINDDAKSFVLARWCDRVKRVANYNQLLKEYNTEAEEQEWKMIKSEQSLINFLTDPKIEPLWYGYRFGELKFKEKFTMSFKTALPSMRDSLWYSDGTKINLYYQDASGKMKTINVYEVMDAYSEVFLGYHISEKEDYEAGYQAFKMAIQVSEHRPYQISLDNGAGNKKLHSGGFFDKISHLAIKTQPYNGKSKTIESAFGRFQTQFLAQLPNYSGQNITSKKVSSHANMEFVLANTEMLPTFAQLKAQYEQKRTEWNQAPHPKTGLPRIEMYFDSENPDCPKVTPFQMVDFFWIERNLPIQCHSSGISFKEKTVQYEYVVYQENSRAIDQEWHIENVSQKFHIKFDPDDMSLIYLYKKTPLGLKFVRAAETKVEIHRGQQEQEDWEAQYYRDQIEATKKIRIATEEKAEANLQKHNMTAESYGFKNPKLKGVNSKRVKKEKTDIAQYQKKLSEAVLTEDDQEFDYTQLM